MRKKLISASLIFLTATFFLPYNLGFADEKSNMKEFKEVWTVERYTKYFYNRYSTHFDEWGIFYMAPDYGVTGWKTPSTAREYMSMAMYYKYRAINGDIKAREILENAVHSAYKKIASRPKNTQSFEDAETVFLMARFLESCEFEQANDNSEFLKLIAEYAEAGIKAPDTENRAIISATHWQYVVDYLSAKGFINSIDKKRYEKMIKDKIDFSIKTNIKDYWYIEGRFDDFTPHYHTVTAYMLMVYSKLTAEEKYERIAEKMYENLKTISFNNGMVEAQIGHRPCGLGAQFYLMAGMLGKSFGDPDYTTYLFYGFGDRFFSDPKHPNRLEYHSTIEGEEPCYHDDYSFVDVAELALAVPSLAGRTNGSVLSEENFRDIAPNVNNDFFHFTYELTIPKITHQEKFILKNTGREIIFGGKKFILGTNGNWSRIVGN